MDRDALASRFDGYCPWCGLPLGDTFAVHHRKLRKHGGTDDPANLVALHHGCHNLNTRSVHLDPARAYEYGYLVRSMWKPEQVPLRFHGGEWFALHNDHTVTTQGGTHEW